MPLKYIELVNILISVILIEFVIWSNGEVNLEMLNQDLPVDMVIVVGRHGWRTAGEARYINDPLKDRQNELWPEGLLQITNRGRIDQYNLGLWLAERYRTLLKDGYSTDTVYALSTDTDRSMISAMCLMSGLFPPKGKGVWNPQLLWQPIPVHSCDNTAGGLLNSYTKVDCPKYWVEFENMMKSPDYIALMDNFRPLREYIYKHTSENLDDFKKFEYLFDYILSQTYQNVTIPEWAEKIFPEPWHSASINYFVLPTFNKPLKRLFMGPLLKEIIQQFESKRSGSNRRKFYLLIGHDDNISNLLNFFGTYNWIMPPFSSAILLELRKSANNEFFVTIFYKNSTEEPYLLTPKGCDSVCSLSSFYNLTASYIPHDWNSECQINLALKDRTVSIWILIPVFTMWICIVGS